MPEVLKNDIIEWLDEMHEDCDKPSRMSNVDTLLCDAYIWQETMVYAQKKFTEAMKELGNVVPSDDKLREQDTGEHTIESGRHFCFMTKIGAGKGMFDFEGFIAAVSARWRISKAKLVAEAENVPKKTSKPSLGKRIVEL